MRFLTNLYHPERSNARSLIQTRPGQTIDEAWNEQREWLRGKVFSFPKPTDDYTVEQLMQMGYVGVYALD